MAIAYDTETTGLNSYCGADMFAYSTCDESGAIEVRRLDKGRAKANTAHLASVLDSQEPLIMHNSKFDLHFTEKLTGRNLADAHPFHDTYIQSHILENDAVSHRLKDRAYELADIPKNDEKQVKRFVDDVIGDYSTVPEFLMDEYQALDAERTALLHGFFFPMIEADPTRLEIYNTELDLIRVTTRMEGRGLMLRRDRCDEMSARLERMAEDCTQSVHDATGRWLNLNSSEHVQWLLYEYLELPILAKTKKAHKPKTDKHVLFALREEAPHPLLETLLQFRAWDKGASTLRKYSELADTDDILHPEIHTCKAITSRQACSRPNLQNVQKSGSLLVPYPVPVREVFRPRPGYINVHVDYSGIEMRLLVHYSGEEELVQIMRDGGDVHQPAAEVFYRDKFILASPKDRKILRGAAKNANFAIPYGASAIKMTKTLGLPVSVGIQRFMDYGARFPRLSSLGRTIQEEVRQTGKVVTTFGRELRVPRPKAYVGTNYKIQGTAAGILKRAQVRLHDYFENCCAGEIRLLLPIHDEVVFEFPRSQMRWLSDVLRDTRSLMVDFPQFNVPLEVEASVVKRDWSKKREVPIAS